MDLLAQPSYEVGIAPREPHAKKAEGGVDHFRDSGLSLGLPGTF